MTARFLLTLALALGLSACSGGDTDDKPTDVTDDTTPGDDDDDATEPTGPTGDPGGNFFNATEIHLSSQFAYDSATRSVRAVDFSGYPLDPDITIVLATASWDGSLQSTSQYCAIVLPLNTATNMQPATLTAASSERGAPLWYGVDYNIADSALTNCNTPGFELDPNVWGADPAYGFLSDYYGGYNAYGIAVGEMTADVSSLLGMYVDPADIVFYLGGRMIIPEWLPGGPGLDDTIGTAFEVDAAFSVVDDGSGYLVPISSASVNLGTNILSAWYSMDALVYWTISP